MTLYFFFAGQCLYHIAGTYSMRSGIAWGKNAGNLIQCRGIAWLVKGHDNSNVLPFGDKDHPPFGLPRM